MMFDATPADAEPGVIVGFMEASNGIEAGRLAPAERQERVIEQAERALGRPGDRAIGYVDLRLERGGMDQGLLRRPLPAGGLDPVWARASRARRSHPLGRDGDRRAMDGLRRRRDRVRHQGRGRGARGPFLANTPGPYPMSLVVRCTSDRMFRRGASFPWGCGTLLGHVGRCWASSIGSGCGACRDVCFHGGRA